MPEKTDKPSATLARCSKSADKQFRHWSPVEANKPCKDRPKWVVDFELDGSEPMVLDVEADGAAAEPILLDVRADGPAVEPVLLDLDAVEVSTTILEVEVYASSPLVLDLDVS